MSARRPVNEVAILGDGFFDDVEAAKFPKGVLRYRNNRAASQIGLHTLNDDEWKAHFHGFKPFEGSIENPMAQRYHGHQFRHYNPEIGDGRGFLFAQFKDGDDQLIDLTTKGSGTTPYSRRGDGRLTLKGAVREILATEMLEALGANTSKTLSIYETGENLVRGDEPSPTRSAVMVRQCHGSIRLGTFQRHAYFSDAARLEKLTDYCLTQFFGGTKAVSAADKALELLDHVTSRTAENAADLMAAGFVHGVLNSDNINPTGEIFDFGPWRFLPTMELMFTAAYFDETGLYAYGRQAEAIHWDLYQLGGTLTELAEEQPIRDVLAHFSERYSTALRQRLVKRLGLKPGSEAEDTALLKVVNDYMLAEKAPYERFFFDFYGGLLAAQSYKESPEAVNYDQPQYQMMLDNLLSREPLSQGVRDHSYFRQPAPCTMLYEEMEAIWAPIADQDDWSVLDEKLTDIAVMRDALAGSV